MAWRIVSLNSPVAELMAKIELLIPERPNRCWKSCDWPGVLRQLELGVLFLKIELEKQLCFVKCCENVVNGWN